MTTRVVPSPTRSDFVNRTNNTQAKGCSYCCARIFAYFEKCMKKQKQDEERVEWHGFVFEAQTTPSHLSSSQATHMSMINDSKTEIPHSGSVEFSSRLSASFYSNTATKVDEVVHGSLASHVDLANHSLKGMGRLEGPPNDSIDI